MKPRASKKSLRSSAAIEICRSRLHLVVAEANSDKEPLRLRARSVVWRKSANSLSGDLGRQELRDALAALASEEKLRNVPLNIALSRNFCVTRVVAGPASQVRQELKKLEQRAPLYLGLGAGHKAIATAISPLDARHEHGLMAVANEKVLDGLLWATTQSGLRVARIEPSLAALSRAVGRAGRDADAPQLLVNLAEEGVELGITFRGRLLLDYRPGGRGESDGVDAVAQHWSRLQRYAARHCGPVGGAKPAGRLERVLLVGAGETVAAAEAKLREEPGFLVERMDPSQEALWQWQGAAPSPEQFAALGCCLAADGSGPDFMEHVKAHRRERMAPRLLRLVWPAAALLLVTLGLTAMNSYEQSRCADIARRIDELEPIRAKAWLLEAEVSRMDRKTAHLKALHEKLANPAWSPLLQQIAQCLPDGAWLSRLAVAPQGKLTLSGMCFNDEGAYEFVRWLDQAPGLRDVQLEAMQPQRLPTGPATAFDVKANFGDRADKTDQESGKERA